MSVSALTEDRRGGDAGARAVLHGAFGVLAALRHLGNARVSELQRRSGLPRSTVRRLLIQLENVGAVESSTGRWRLGPTVFELGAGVPASRHLRAVARRPLMDLATGTGELVALVVESAGELLVIEVLPGTRPLAFEPEPGMSLRDPRLAPARAYDQARRGDLRTVLDAGAFDRRISPVCRAAASLAARPRRRVADRARRHRHPRLPRPRSPAGPPTESPPSCRISSEGAHMSKVTPPLPTAQPSTTHVQSLVIRLDGITAGDYLAWVRDPEPPGLDHGLRSVTVSAKPLGELVNIELVWAGQPPTTPSAAAVAAGFALIPEVAAVLSATCTADRPRSTVEVRTNLGLFSEPFSHRAAVGRSSQTRC